MTDARDSQFRLRVLDESTLDVNVPQFRLRTVFNYPAEYSRTSQYFLRSVDISLMTINVSQLFLRTLIIGRAPNPRLRAWTYSLDGHDYYVLRLGDDKTLVYDLYSEQWSDWVSPERTNWRLTDGMNWIGGTEKEPFYGSNILVGDDSYGLIWFLNPDQPYDQNPNYLAEDQTQYFERVVMGQVPVTGRAHQPCYVIHLTADPGEPAYPGAGVTLNFSDDSGQTFTNFGTIEVTQDEFTQPQLSWYSLGLISAPGRLFKIVDDGAVARIDSMDMNDDGG